MVKIASYGTWGSPVAAADVAQASSSPAWVTRHACGVWWTQAKPAEGGRLALTRDDGHGAREVLGAPWNARNRVHEYGGRPYALLDTPDGARVAFTHWGDQRVYLLDPDEGDPAAISAAPDRPHGVRHADLVAGPAGTQVWCVRETVTGERPTDVRRDLVALPIDGGPARVLAASHHFMTVPKPSPDGRHAAWIGWEHPNMPWDGAELCVAEILRDGAFGPHRVLAGGPREAVCQVEWESPATLLALTDPDGWWNLHRVGIDGTAVNLAPGPWEIGGPLWQLGKRWFAALGRGRFAVLRGHRLAILDERTGTVTDVDSDFTRWSDLSGGEDGVVTACAAGPFTDWTAVRLDLSTGDLTELSAPAQGLPDPAYLPEPVARVFQSPDGREIPAYVYPPTNPDHAAPDGELPPYLVHVHGGPTGQFSPVLDLEFVYFTSRGFGVVAVDYGGSTGYGRAFREALDGQWGVVDVRDCATVAAALAAEGVADPARLAVRGGSAGGWTAAASMTTVDTYACATIMFPILDLEGWTSEGAETHDFESRYVEGLVGPLPEFRDRYRDRSPANHVDRLTGPVLLLQGLDDEICPPEQADRFVAALDGTGVPHAYLTFEGEQHGFRKAETITAAHEAELSFYGQVFGFTPPGVPVLGLRR
ncbi:S9 family peptidase [Actinokineospora iranica]|uniref:Dipeptidyl aminopeptidase/acylaminoacyl peptidase n=1 Tax=Actinokineospora iranica TaxID=1271860 RepID=A0A1G6IPR7_9PSEU|nr:prolyl oligopeptidase family serine peptidase [Actinokineospora iranica]SDC08484.1 Dipeptidyl aminopeptidase/acylaminoacyl peptidase [Actinokineospora iranica]